MNDSTHNQSNLNLNVAPEDFSDLSGAFFSEQFAAPVGEKFVIFYLGEQPFGIASKLVAEFSRPLAVAPLPNAPEWLAGIANLRGEIVSVLDLARMLKQPAHEFYARSKFIVLHTSEADAAIAFNADRLGEIVFINEQEIQPAADGKDSLIGGKAAYEGKHLQIIDVPKLLAALTVA